MWCSHCQENVRTTRPFDGSLACAQCGKVLEDYNFSLDPTFEKDASGQGRLTGRYVKSVESDFSASRERTLQKAEDGISNLCYGLGIDQAHGLVKSALGLYKIALGKNFTRGRRSEHVEAACLYIACREKKAPYLLIDFSNLLTVNVYVLGAVFLQLCKALSLEEHPIVQKPLDPSIFIHKYTNYLSGGRNNDVEKSALRIIARMNRDWMQTGRKPSGLWGAAVYISAIAHGIKCSKTDILRLVHICEATLTKRLVEFEDTESGSLTIEELNTKAHEKQSIAVDKSDPRDLLCVHKGTSTPHFAIGLCHSCYDEFVEISGGLEGGLDPPAFQRAERERAKRENLEKSLSKEISDDSIMPEKLDYSWHMDGTKATGVDHSKCDNGSFSEINDTSTQHGDESDNLSDIDDIEVEGYLHNEEEKRYKKIIWEEMNREYLEEQAAKEAAAAAAKEASAANFNNDSEDVQAAQELAAAAAASVAKSRKERQQKRAAEARNLAPAETAVEAARRMLTKKRLSSKINYDVLEKLFDDPVASGNSQKKQKESHLTNDDEVSHKSSKDLESNETDKDADTGLDDENEDMEGDHDNDLYNDNVDVMYDYDDDYGYEDFE